MLIYNSTDGMQVGGLLFDIINNLQIWLIILVTTFACVFPHIVIRRWEVIFSVDIINNLRHKKYQQDFTKKNYVKKIEEMTKYTRSLAKFKKIFNKDKNYEPENLNDKKIKAVVDGFKIKKEKSKILNINKEKTQVKQRKLSNYEERSLNQDNKYASKINSKNSISIKNESSKLKAYADANNMNINIINNNVISSSNIQKNYNESNTYSKGKHSNTFKYPSNNNLSSNSNQQKNRSISQTNNSNNYNYNYIHPYDEDDLVNEHLRGKYKPITNNNRRVLNKEETTENLQEYQIIKRDVNNKFEFNFKKFTKNNDDINRINPNDNDELNTEEHLIKNNNFFGSNNTNRNLIEQDENQNILEKNINMKTKKNFSEFYSPNGERVNVLLDEYPNLIENNFDEEKNFTLKQSKNSGSADIKDLTFKQKDKQIKSSLTKNFEDENNLINSDSLKDSKKSLKNIRDPLIHEYPLEMTQSMMDDAENNMDNEFIPGNNYN